MAADGALDGATKPEAVQSLGSQFKKVEVRKKNFNLQDFYKQARQLMNLLMDESYKLRSQIATLTEQVDEKYGEVIDQVQPTFRADYAKLK